MKTLIIGYGSIGKRHEEVLLNIPKITQIDIVTKQSLLNKNTFISLDSIIDIETYDYFVIATETNKHYTQLKFLDSKVRNKIIFCEKPLFQTSEKLDIVNNKVFIGYVLRFHPLLQQLKNKLETQQVLSVNAYCGQYLPDWRPNTDYTKTYSASKVMGGGVLLDLSHEIDYIQWLCGDILELKSYQVQISDLKINSDDMTTVIGKTVNNVFINLSLDYISKLTRRKLLIHTINSTYELDFIKNTLIERNKEGLEHISSFSNLERNHMFTSMHKAIILNGIGDTCTYAQGINVMQTITKIQKENNV